MPRTIAASAVLILWITCCVSPAPAQTQAEPDGFGAGLANKLDQWGKNLAGAFSPKKAKDKQATPVGSATGTRSAASAQQPAFKAGTGRVGGVVPSAADPTTSLSRDDIKTNASTSPAKVARVVRPTALATQFPSDVRPADSPSNEPLPETSPARPTRPAPTTVTPSRNPPTTVAPSRNPPTTVVPSRNPTATATPSRSLTDAVAPLAGGGPPAGTVGTPATPSVASDETEDRGLFERPLHQRLMGFQRSAFSPAEPASPPTAGRAAAPSASGLSERAADLDPPPVASTVPTAPTASTAPSVPMAASPSEANRPTLASQSRQPAIAQPDRAGSPAEAARITMATAPASPRDGVTTATSSTANDAMLQGAFRHRPTDGVDPTSAAMNSAAKTNSGGDEDDGKVLFARQSPNLNVQTLGPKRIMVGKESTYEVAIENRGQVAANDVVVIVDLPSWAEVLGVEASIGSTASDRSPTEAKQFRWKVGLLEAAGRERMVLRIVPRESRPIDMAVKWDFTPVASEAVIEVQEPRLAMRLEGPREVFYAKSQVYKLEIVNSGNGEAADLVLLLMPLVPGEAAPMSHNLGTLAAGKTKTLEIEMTARQKGKLTVQAELRCDGRVHAKLDEAILVRKADVALAVEGPRVQYVGTVAAYQIRVHNGGNAAATNLTVTAKIPPEAKFVVADEGGKASADGSKAVWVLDHLDQGAERILQLKCQLVRDGSSQIEVQTAGDDDLAATAATATQVDSMADLALEVSDPSGPVPVGEEAVYELRITNRGTKRADGVEAIAYFSRGVEPVSVEGSSYAVGPGQVVFDAIGEIAPGKEVVLKIRARAASEGNHMFRAEVYCKAVGTKLVGEETTHFYGGEVGLTRAPADRVQR